MSSTARAHADVEAVIRPVVGTFGLDVEGIDLKHSGGTRRLSLLVDKDGGVTVDECAEVSRQVSAALDEADVLGGSPYTLEVGSPGATRPLTLPRHWRRARGRLVKIVGTDGSTTRGRVVRGPADDDPTVLVEVDGEQQTVAVDSIAKARVEVEFRSMPGGES